MTKKQNNHGKLSFGFEVPAVPAVPEVKDKQGRRANKTGNSAEATIYCIFRERGYEIRRHYAIGDSIYKHPLKVDFYIRGLPMFPDGLIIESKWQQTPGSVDEKFAYLVRNIRERYPCPAIIIYGGGGARTGAIEWMKEEVDGKYLFAVFSFEDLLIWLNNNL